MKGEKNMALVEVVDSGDSVALTTFERFMRDPAVDVDKLERLMQMHERATARSAEEAFNAAMSKAQADMRPIATDADNPQTRSKYASYNAIDRALRPIYTTHGFGLSFDTGDGAADQWVRVLCYVTHASGHARTYHADMPADGKGAKGGDVMTRTHAVGAAMSYGMRYLLKMIFNVAVGEDDRDGNGGQSQAPPPPPAGYVAWLAAIEVTATAGAEPLRDAWRKSLKTFTTYLTTHDPALFTKLKAKAGIQ